jgi:Holliday junction resolvase RusA-like endonuclease
MTVFCLPFPPSVNSLYRNAPKPHMKRPKTKRYLEWITEAGWELKAQRVIPTRGPVKLTYELYNNAKGLRKWDYANREKAVTDLLVEHGIIEADHRLIVKELTVKGTDEIVGVRVTITPYLVD